ncbi:MAG: hypothetical protein OXI63_01525 [Candidatus Poribacteria bacterium]|nr:hypothetical protein [Candidatus Poribacteria bacterium]
MKTFITCILLVVITTIIFSLSFGQHNQNAQKPNPEVETLKIQLQAVENENIELTTKLYDTQTKLANANTKLINAEFGKFKRELRDSNDAWLWTWTQRFIGIISVSVLIIGGAFWFWLRSRADQLIVNSVEKHLNGFETAVAQVDIVKNELKEAVGQVNILKDQIRILEKEHAASVLEGSVHLPDSQGYSYSETVKALPEDGLLDLIADKTRGLDFRYKAAEVLFVRKNPKLVSPVLELLNLVVDSNVEWDKNLESERHLRRLINFLGHLHTQETYEGLTKFLDRLLTKDTELKDLLLTWTVFSLSYVSSGLNKGDSVSLLKTAIPYLNVELDEDRALKNLAAYFDRFNEPEGIKEILTHHAAGKMSELGDECLELLQKHDPEFVRNWKAEKETANTQNEESE